MEAAKPLRVIIVNELVMPAEELYERGATAITYKTLRPSDLTAAQGAKIGNYLVAVMAMRVAREQGAHEALIVDQDGCVVEGASSNLFYVSGGEVRTPPERAGILPGITRARAIEAAQRLGLVVKYVSPTISELMAAGEIFISSSIRELMPIVRVDGQPIGDARVGPVTRRIRDSFRELVRGEGGIHA
jgi:branched-chain amino acid aminotransferase